MHGRVARLISDFGLKFTDVRLMQTATQAILSGSAVPFILGGGSSWSPSDLDFFTGRDMGHTAVLFFKRTGKYAQRSFSNRYTMSQGIRRIWTLENYQGKKINVVESLSSNPFDAIVHSHSTSVMGAVTASGVWHAYPKLTMNSRSLITPTTVPLKNSIRNHRYIWAMLHKYVDRGFTFHLGELGHVHKCGEDLFCPVTLRCTSNKGCLFIPFPTWDYASDVKPYRKTCWTLGGTGCRHGDLRGNDDEDMISLDEVARWPNFLISLLSLTSV